MPGPGSVQSAAPVTVLPLSLCKSFVHERAYPLIENEYKNGESQRSVLATNSRRRWRMAKRLAPVALVALRNFFDARNGSAEPFYFYDPYDTNQRFSYGPTGVATVGRCIVRFNDRIAYLRPDMGRRLKEYLALRGKVERDGDGTPLFSAVGNRRRGKRLSRRHIRVQTDRYLQATGLKRPGISNHALRHTAGTLGYLHTGDLRAVQDFMGHADPRMTAKYAHVVDMAKKNPALFIPVKVG
jgi:hypothetical protein